VERPTVLSAGRSDLGGYSEQLGAIILIVSTFSVGLLADGIDEDDALESGLVLLALSSVPLISTLWPTCAVSFASSALKR
jgi:hypothetical protein